MILKRFTLAIAALALIVPGVARPQSTRLTLASVEVVPREGRPPVLRLTANGPIAWRAIDEGRTGALHLKIYGVAIGVVQPAQNTVVGRISMRADLDGNLLVDVSPRAPGGQWQVRLGKAANVLEIVGTPQN